MKRYSVLICLLLELCVNPCFARPGKPDSMTTVVQSFTILRSGASVKILWQTSSEKNNNYFELQRSADGQNFSAIALVFAREDAPDGSDYSYIDNSLSMAAPEFIYYRIRQVDMDGKFRFTEVRKVRAADNRADL